MEGHLNKVFTFMHKVSVTHRDLKTPEIGVGGFRNIVWCGNFCQHWHCMANFMNSLTFDPESRDKKRL